MTYYAGDIDCEGCEMVTNVTRAVTVTWFDPISEQQERRRVCPWCREQFDQALADQARIYAAYLAEGHPS